ncbi:MULTISPECIES: 2-acyl-glycerophospho-ethanolamine acyltransferase [Mesorhizobium]|uniref:2-acyl-glycerophospho-ethanolamine acyltransferase n=1 Tax=Mesorhizobium denitrificans TaxID=2294114 RepID=A0A371XIQ7_9HYPH|nr:MULTISPECIES: 2-acyl-glycerophospho-ethanolamine acyltransferase [Mesorhizobium]RFC69102.1 2-acyl-glycerophospho-ethanolamine acyltransferase [Mesorhizobium denitrificans]
MILTGKILLLLLMALAAYSGWLAYRLGISFRQAIFYLPLKLFYRVDDSSVRGIRSAPSPVVYVVSHRSRLEPALALSLLPDNTLHILDAHSARSAWLEPYRELARTIAFNTEHLFVNRRLVRHLRGGGRLAVYLPDGIQPNTKEFRLYRAISRIAESGRASIVPLHFEGTRYTTSAFIKPEDKKLFPQIQVIALPAKTILELAALSGERGSSHALYARLNEVREPEDAKAA